MNSAPLRDQMPSDPKGKTPSPVYLRLTPELFSELEALADTSGLSRHSITLSALRLGLQVIREKMAENPDFLVEEQVKAKVSAIRKTKEKPSQEED